MADKTTPQQPGPASGSANEAGTEADAHRSQAPATEGTDPKAGSGLPDANAPEGPDGTASVGLGLGAGADVAAVLAAEVETLQSQIGDLTDRLLRAHADLDNLRKRAEREKQETARYAITSFAKDTVGLVDNFERAIQAVSPEAIEKDQHLKALLDGVAMTEREFLNVLERHGVKRVSPKGQSFDPRLHQAVMERQDPSVANGTVVEVFQSGYTIEDRCLRPAMVVVARGGGKAEQKANAASDGAPKAATDGADADAEKSDASEADAGKAAPSSDNDNPSA